MTVGEEFRRQRERRRQYAELRAQGLSYREIGERFSRTRGAVFKLLNGDRYEKEAESEAERALRAAAGRVWSRTGIPFGEALEALRDGRTEEDMVEMLRGWK